MADKDALASLLALAESVKSAQTIVADAKAKADSAKMANIHAEEKLKAAEALKADLDKRDASLKDKEAKLNDRASALASAEAANQAASKALAAREGEIVKNEQRVTMALDAAEKAKKNAENYEGQAYAKLESVKATLSSVAAA